MLTQDTSGRRRAAWSSAAKVAAALAVLLVPCEAPAYPPTLGKELISADMPADVRQLVEQLYSQDAWECVAAVRALGAKGPAAVSAAPFLASMLPGHFGIESANSAAVALVRMGKGAFDATAAATASTDFDARRRAVEALVRIDAQRAIPVLLDLFVAGLGRDPELDGLRMIGLPALEAVRRALESPDAVMRRAAVRALPAFTRAPLRYHSVGLPGGAGRSAAAAHQPQLVVDLLLRAVGDADAQVRLGALESLARVAEADPGQVPLAETLRAALGDADPAVRLAALGVTIQTDPEGQAKFDALAPLLADPDPALRKGAVAALGSMADERPRAVPMLVKALEDADAAVRGEAALALGKLRAAEAEPPLLKALEDPARPVQVAATLALGRCGGRAGVEAVMGLTQTDDPLVRFEAARALAERCLDLRGVHWDNRLAFWMTGRQDPWDARSGLLPLPPPLRESFPYDRVNSLMAELLQGPDPDLHTAAAEALMEGVHSGVPDAVLLAALKSPAKGPQSCALLYMERLRSVPDERFLEPLRHIARTGSEWPGRDRMAVSVLIRMGDTQTVLRHCERLLGNRHPKIACGAAGLLTALGDPGLDLLLKHLGDPRADVQGTIVHALATRTQHPRVQAFVASALKSQDDRLRRGAEQVMAMAYRAGPSRLSREAELRAAIFARPDAWRPSLKGKRDPSVVQAATTLLKDPDALVRGAAVDMLAEMGDPSAAPALRQALADESAAVRAGAIEALAVLGDRQAADAVLAAMEDPEEAVREAAASALGRLADPAALGPLVQAMAGPDGGLRRAAAQALGALADPRAAETLTKALAADPDWAVRAAAATALGRRKETASVPALVASLADGHWYVRRAAHEALKTVTGQDLPADVAAWRAWWAGLSGAAAAQQTRE